MKFRLTLPQIRLIIIIFALLVGTFSAGFWLGENKPQVIQRNILRESPKKAEVDLSLFWDVWDRLESSYLDKSKIDSQKMIYGAISGMVASLGDPYTIFLPPQEQKQAREDLSGAFEGVGIQLGYKEEKVAVIAPLNGTPAEKSGIKAGDLIIHIEDEKKKIDNDTEGMNLQEVMNQIRGPKGTEVVLTLGREGKENFEVKLKRETIIVKSAEVAFKDSVAHLKLLRFGERTNQEWEEAVNQIVAKIGTGEVKGVILDLRNNPGGFLQGSVFIASEFLKNGPVVKQEASKNGGTQTYPVNRKGRLLEIPLIVLINPGSASASEIVAGVLQETGRAKLVGEKSFGKGTIQEAEDLPEGAGLHVTVARWLLPSGASIDKEGIKPDYEVKMDEADETRDPQLEKAIEIVI